VLALLKTIWNRHGVSRRAWRSADAVLVDMDGKEGVQVWRT